MRPRDLDAVLNDPVSRELLSSAIPARLAYVGRDGAPRAIPIGFHWDGGTIVAATVPTSAKVPALRANPSVALTIDTNGFPPNVLLIRGTARVEVVDGVPEEYLRASRKVVGDEGMPQFEAEVRHLYASMARIEITPHWAKVMDFTTPERMPRAVADLIGSPG